ncbi:F-box domain-containing protein [Caenorhabditis elegans]|uniref:F-box domain-containing protein n=1 Tax=Caenorhabditis elegans TaxID=6239 RepID=O76637_CAEEL|nr:F-box domain-containing protein [Caenorhabditis elegans]CCD63725.1 F-box domain-containing protein [Caenorhabditis elegans]|eukprot:NP_494083.1 F-box B protein [Caenorhabditis elegans]
MGEWPDLSLPPIARTDVFPSFGPLLATMSSFSLLRLPKNELSKVLRHMDPTTQFWFSLLTERTKRLISVLQVFGDEITIRVETCVQIDLGSLRLNIGSSVGILEMGCKDPEDSGYFVTTNWCSPRVTPRQWIDHCMELTDSNSIDQLSIFAYNEGFDMRACYRNLTGLHVTKLHLNGDHLPDIQMFGSLPNVDEICFGFNLPVGPNYQRIIARNVEKFTMENSDGAQVQLNDLLASNAWFIQLTNMSLPNRQINLFLKHWIAGSNEMLCGFVINQFNNGAGYNEAVISNGIDYQPSMEEHHGVQENNYHLHPHTRKFDIRRDDGMRATFYWELGWKRDVINGLCCMFVWENLED